MLAYNRGAVLSETFRSWLERTCLQREELILSMKVTQRMRAIRLYRCFFAWFGVLENVLLHRNLILRFFYRKVHFVRHFVLQRWIRFVDSRRFKDLQILRARKKYATRMRIRFFQCGTTTFAKFKKLVVLLGCLPCVH